MNLQEHIRRILKEETYFKVSNDDYSDLIKDAVLSYVDFDMCAVSIQQLDNLKDQYLVLLIVEKQLKSSYREELQDFLNKYIPLKYIYVSISDGQDCQKYKKGRSQQEQKYRTQSTMGLIDESNDFEERLYIDWDENYGNSFKIVYTPKGSQTGGEWNPDLISIVTPENTNAWYEWEELPEEKLMGWKKNWDRIQKGLGDHKYNQILRSMSNNQQEMKEGELTERCWKGYTQKGMKTMFGKRYPNCVKKKK